MSSSHCAAARPMVPPKPDKDKHNQEEQHATIGTNTPSSSGVSTEESNKKKTTTTTSSWSSSSSVRQTIGTQVNMLNKSQPTTSASSPSSSSTLSTGTSPARATGNSSELIKSPPGVKPALPPKPKSGLVCPRKPPVGLPTSPSCQAQASASQKSANEAPKSDPKCPEAAPVARLDEFENLNDLSSPGSSSLKLRAGVAPAKPGGVNANVSKLKPPVSPVRATSPSSSSTSGRNCVQIPSAFKVQSSSSSSSSQSPKSLPSSGPSNLLKSPNNSSSVQPFQRSPNPPSLPKPLFSPQEIALRQAKSASLGRNFNFTQLQIASNNNVTPPKKSSTLARVLPLDLNWGKSSSLGGQAPHIGGHPGPYIGGQSGSHTAPTVPNRPLNFPRPVSFAPCEGLLNGAIPPPPPPRMKKAQKSLSVGSPTSPTSPGLSPSMTAKPVYAVVDKEKKWAARLQKQLEQELEGQQQQQLEQADVIQTAIEEEPLECSSQPLDKSLSNSVNNNLNVSATGAGTGIEIKPQESSVTDSSAVPTGITTTETTIITTTRGAGTSTAATSTMPESEDQRAAEDQNVDEIGTCVRSSLTVTTSWLAKLIDAEVQSDLGNIISHIDTQTDVIQMNPPAPMESSITLPMDDKSSDKPSRNPVVQDNKSNHDPLGRNESYLFAIQAAKLRDGNLASLAASLSGNGKEDHQASPNLLADIIKQLKPKQQLHTHLSGHSSPELPLRSQIPDEFELELENQLESQEAKALQLASATFTEADEKVKLLREKYMKQKAFQQPRSNLVSSNGSESCCSEIKPDPRAYLQLVDARLQSMQTLLANFSTEAPQDSVPEIKIQDEDPEDSQKLLEESNGNVDEPNGNPAEFNGNDEESNGNMEEIPQVSSSSPRQSDGEIISNILLSSKRFENKLARRMSTDNKLENNYESDPKKEPPASTQRQVSMDESFLRRSWTCSDYSPSPSESSSSSSVSHHPHPPPHHHPPHHHHHHNTNTVRRKQSSWVDEDEDLSTGALGDAESSDAPVPSSNEDIESSLGKQKKKRGISSIFSSFGKGEPEAQPPRRSQFFVDESSEGNRRDRTGSLPAGRSLSIEESAMQAHAHVKESRRNPHRPLVRSAGSATALITSTAAIASVPAAVPASVEASMNSASNCGNFAPSMPESSMPAGPKGYEDVLAELDDASQRKSFFVAREILTSERTFVDVLNLLTIDFPNAVKAANESQRMAVIGKTDLDFILGGLPILKAVNEVLVSELEKRIPRWKESPKVADIIVKNGPFLKHYSTYVRDFERIMQKLDHCCAKYSSFARTVRDFEATERCQKLGLKHYMLKPVQRMPQYRLLLEDYLKTLTEESEDWNDTIKAIAIVKEVAEHANEAINLQITNEKLVNLQNRLPNSVVLKPNRLLIKEGELLKVCRKELQPRYFALMTDCLLCMTYNASSGAPSMKDLKLRYELPLAGMRISLPASESYSNEFSVISTARSFNLVAKTARERDEWMKAISAAIQENIRKRACNSPDLEKEFRIGHEAPVWIQDKRVTMCQVCTAEFTVTFRRHHCRACGKVVCSNCSGNQAPLYYHNNDAARVCDDCYQYLLEEFDRENREKMTDEVEELRSRFKKLLYSTTGRKSKKAVPDVFKSPANNSGCQISGYLNWKERKAWKRQWFVLMDRVLYVYAASEDIVAVKTIPVLGYQVEPVCEENTPGSDGLVFRLMHTGQNPILFAADNTTLTEKWIAAIQEATVLT